VFVHGAAGDHRLWQPQLSGLTDEFTVIAWDEPGAGRSSDTPADFTLADYANCLAALLDHLGLGRVHLAGLSWGGTVILELYRRHPDKAATLILADTFAVHPDGTGIYQRSTEASRSMTMRALAEARVDMLIGTAASPKLRAEVVDTMAAIDPEAYRIGAEAVWLADQRGSAARIAVPTLVLCGTEDRITPPELSEELAGLIPGARLEMIDDAGHLANAEQPTAFNAALDKFLAEAEQIFLS
jgi:3-oxoadipate enol-lactonase